MNSWKSLIIGATLLLSSVAVQAQNRPTRPSPQRPVNEDIRLVENINQQFSNQSQIAVGQLFNLFRDYQDYKVKELRLSASSAMGRGQAQLVINNATVGYFQQIGQTRSNTIFSLSDSTSTVGDTLKSLRLNLRGNIHVSNIALTLEAPAPKLEVVERSHWFQYAGTNRIQVNNILQLGQQHNGKSVEFVELTAYSYLGRAQAQLWVNGRAQGQAVLIDNNKATIAFELNNTRNGTILGRDIQNIEILVMGYVRTETLSVGLLAQSTRNPVPPTRPVPLPKVVEKELNVLVTGSQNISLESIVADARYSEARVATVEITGRARTTGQVRVCEQWNSRSDCRSAQTIRTAQSFTSHYIGGARLKDLIIQAQGQLVVQKVTIRFE